ncbi:MAG TPA: potassium transporter TrkG, partial [Kiloniellales bacterium]|nr:potassium transporter TrkG [Kiloniellales bacterium]
MLHVFALCLVAEGLFMLLPALVDSGRDESEATVFLGAAAIAAFVGGALALTTRQHRMPLSLRQTFLLTPLCWYGLPVFGALPFMFGETDLSFTDAYFETVSGFTTTGSTVIVGLDRLGSGLLLWRGLLQAQGGIGFIVIALAVLPVLRVGGMQIMRTESSDRSEKVLPRASQIAAVTTATYVALAVVAGIAFWAAGMTPLEATLHAFSSISTGGFSTSDLSLGKF